MFYFFEAEGQKQKNQKNQKKKGDKDIHKKKQKAISPTETGDKENITSHRIPRLAYEIVRSLFAPSSLGRMRPTLVSFLSPKG